jgi:hypothetical protein
VLELSTDSATRLGLEDTPKRRAACAREDFVTIGNSAPHFPGKYYIQLAKKESYCRNILLNWLYGDRMLYPGSGCFITQAGAFAPLRITVKVLRPARICLYMAQQ